MDEVTQAVIATWYIPILHIFFWAIPFRIMRYFIIKDRV